MYCLHDLQHRIFPGGMSMSRCGVSLRRRIGAVFAFGGVMIVFVCLPAQAFLIVLGVSMTAFGVVLLDIS